MGSIGAVVYDQSGSSFGFFGLKTTQGTLSTLDRVIFRTANTNEFISIDFDISHLPNRIEFSTGEVFSFSYNKETLEINVVASDSLGNTLDSFSISKDVISSLSEAQSFMNSNPMVVSLCRKREKTIKVNHLPSSFIDATGDILNVISEILDVGSFIKKPRARDLLMIFMKKTKSILLDNLPIDGAGKNYIHTINSLGDWVSGCLGSNFSCMFETIKNIGIPILHKLNEGSLELGEISI